MNYRLPALAIFSGSFLLFMLQPMLGRTLLPSFGGTAAVWTTCLAAYQLLLVAGYFYAHRLAKQGPAQQKKWHVGLLCVAVVWVGAFGLFRPALQQMIGISGMPAVEVLITVIAVVGVPYVLLGAGSSLVQAFVSRSAGRDTYGLYAISNLGSLLGLAAYPFLLEPFFGISAQWMMLTVALGVYVILMALLLKSGVVGEARKEGPVCAKEVVKACGRTEGEGNKLFWFAIPAVSCFILNSVTAHVTLDVLPLPLLWVLLLALFLLSYVVGFTNWAEKHLPALAVAAILAVIAATSAQFLKGQVGKFELNLGAACAFCFFGCSFLHAWLYSMRPHTDKLTLYYLGNAVGGAIGGIGASVIAPLVFTRVFEYPLSFFMVAVFFAIYTWTATVKPMRFAGIPIALGVAIFCAIRQLPDPNDRPVIYRDRGFFGTVVVTEVAARTSSGKGVLREFIHGTTVHGVQALIPGKERMPTSYYTPKASGWGIVAHPKYRNNQPMRVNLTGLGVGVLLSYARPGDYYRCYEISKEVVKVATNINLFTFVSGSPAKTEVILQDARKGLEAELAQGVEPYDVIIVDAFTGDNLPYHLSTREAFELYFKLLKPDGILVINISNWHLELEPFVKAIGDAFHVPLVGWTAIQDLAGLSFQTKVAFFCRQPQNLGALPEGIQLTDYTRVPAMRFLPTDDKGSFVSLIRK